MISDIYAQNKERKLYLRSTQADPSAYERLRRNLLAAQIIAPDYDYDRRAFRVLSLQDLPAEEIVCLIDPTCHISHLSAMQRWGITNRRPKALSITRPNRPAAKKILNHIVERDYGDQEPVVPITIVSHPKRVRKRPLVLHESTNPSERIKVRGTHACVSTMGQTFLESLKDPDLCGGMRHVLRVWERHARDWVQEIINRIDQEDVSGIVKCRAGYILEEVLSVKNNVKIESWISSAQRGGSRKLDPNAPFLPRFSEKWMISLNVK
ncbi:hypothetical protein [Nisaea sp.]|uniref:hypothetical protein n=1 Tax=Nisaea sp. TaxID=2024842 RepID=UPI0032F04267